jgi:hypothetical protein
MASLRMQPEYGPTLGQLLAPRWRAASRAARWAAIGAAVALVAVLVAAALTLENPAYSHSGRVSFSFGYRGLYRVAPDAGGYVKVQSHSADGALKYSYAVAPLELPPYAGELTGELPLYAVRYTAFLRARFADFVLAGEGKAKVNGSYGYAVFYTTVVDGREMWGRDVLLVPERPGAREGVAIEMLAPAVAVSGVQAPIEVGSAGVLEHPLKSFTFG